MAKPRTARKAVEDRKRLSEYTAVRAQNVNGECATYRTG